MASYADAPRQVNPVLAIEYSAEAVLLSQLSFNSNAYVGKQVYLIGFVDDVCPVRGCWANV